MSGHDLEALADEQYAYLTTTGRITDRPHEIEIWFSTDGESVHLLSGNGAASDWVQNLHEEPLARLRIAGETAGYRARFDLDAEERRAAAQRHASKYDPDAAARWADAHLIALDPT